MSAISEGFGDLAKHIKLTVRASYKLMVFGRQKVAQLLQLTLYLARVKAQIDGLLAKLSVIMRVDEVHTD